MLLREDSNDNDVNMMNSDTVEALVISRGINLLIHDVAMIHMEDAPSVLVLHPVLSR